MKSLRLLAAILLPLALSAQAVHAQDALPAGSQQDVRCIIVGLAVATAKDDKTQQAGERMALYYLGRFEIAAPGADLDKAIREATPDVQANISKLGPVCGEAFNARMKTLTGIAARLAGAPPP
jgi:hypothetical protein